jgi:LPS-assembly protein
MPPFMLRPSPFWIVLLSLGSITSVAWAEEPPPCPTEIPPAPQETTAQSQQPQRPVPPGNIDFTTDEAIAGVNGQVTLKGNVEVRQGDRSIRADRVDYDQKTDKLRSQGNVEYTDSIVHVTGEGGNYSPTEGADFKSAEFSLRQRSARGAADSMQLTPQGVISLRGVMFTTCPAGNEGWSLRANDITLDTRSRVGTGRGARVEFEGVPVVYLPWMSFPLGTQRKSGFLFPSIGQTTRSGVQLAVPYYWNIAPNADLTFEPIIYSKRGTDVGGETRLLTQNQHTELEWNYLPSDRVYGDSRSRVRLENSSELPREFHFSIDATNVSDSQYFEDFAQSPEGTSTAFVERRATLSFRDEHWRFDGQAQQYQTIDTTLAPTDRPYARAPWLVLNADYGFGPGSLLRYGFDSELVNFQRDVGVTGWRADLMPAVSLNLIGAGYFMRPAIAWRATQYQLSDVAPGQEHSPSRTLPIASFDTGLLFERDPDSHGRKLTLEPRLLYLYVPFRDQSQIPLFDTAVPDLNLVELFRTNRYVGADRQGDANQVSAGVTSRLLDAQDGRQFISATLGQTYYFTTPRVTLPGEAPLTSRSDFVAQLNISAFKNWNADLGLQWNPRDGRSERTEINLQYRPSGEQVVNVGYRYQRGLLEQTDVSGAWPINRRWFAFARGVYSIQDHQAIERFVGFEYRACCWRVRMLARRFVSSRPPSGVGAGEQTNGFYLQLELTGLASVGSAADSFLTEAIRGYTRPEAALGKTTPGP